MCVCVCVCTIAFHTRFIATDSFIICHVVTRQQFSNFTISITTPCEQDKYDYGMVQTTAGNAGEGDSIFNRTKLTKCFQIFS